MAVSHAEYCLTFFPPGVIDPNIPEEGPSAPPPGWLDNVHGYEGHGGGGESEVFLCFVFLSSFLNSPL